LEAMEGPLVRSVGRAVDILIALGHHPLALGEVSEMVGLTKPTTYRLLTTLRSKGMVVQNERSGRYGLGPSCFHLMSSLTSGSAGMVFESTDALERLRDETQETVTVHVRAGRSRLCIMEFPSPQAIRYTAGVGVTEDIHVGSAGKVLLAFTPREERERLLAGMTLHATTPATVTDLARLREELGEIEGRGVAYSFGERVAGAVGVSAPITSGDAALAALSVLGPASRLADERLDAAEGLVRDAAARISATVEDGQRV
jgi:DNA-binding IclR family transcriptional regulator